MTVVERDRALFAALAIRRRIGPRLQASAGTVLQSPADVVGENPPS